jgi:HEAT repeat protein
VEGVVDSAGDDRVRDTLLEALEHDANPGVRVEAVNLLVRSLEREGPDNPVVAGTPSSLEGSQIPPDPSVDRVIRALEGLQRSDPNRYVRLRSAAALRQIGPREMQ